MPFHTDKLSEKQCLPNSTLRNQYYEFIKSTVFKDHCHMPCASMEVLFSSSSQSKEGPKNEAYIKFYFLNIIKVQKSVWSYPVVTLLADVGGYMGALLGMSLLDLNKVFNWLYNLYLQRFN